MLYQTQVSQRKKNESRRRFQNWRLIWVYHGQETWVSHKHSHPTGGESLATLTGGKMEVHEQES